MATPDGWDERDGRLPVGHILGWQTAMQADAGLLRIRIAQTEAQVAKGGVALQLVVPPDMARRLARDLEQIADMLEPGCVTRQ
jgi:hypothetical protein